MSRLSRLPSPQERGRGRGLYLTLLTIFAITTSNAQPIPPAETTNNARYIFTVYTPTSQQEALVWQTPETKLTTHRVQLNDSTEIRLQPVKHTVLRTFVNLGGGAELRSSSGRIRAGAMSVNEEQGSPTLHEVLCYDQLLSPEQRQLTESYLAIKHGLTLDQTLPTNYLAPGPGSQAHPVWTSTADREFRHRIIGLARDTAIGLERFEGFSILAPDLLRISWGVTPDTTAYLLVADNGNPTARDAYAEDDPGHITLGRKWRVEASVGVPPTTVSFDPQRLFDRARPGETWMLKVRCISTLIHPDSAPTFQLIAPTPTTDGRLAFQLPPGATHFQLALRCADCEDHSVTPETTFFRFAQLSPNPSQAGQASQLRVALENQSTLLITAFDVLGREVLHQALSPDTHHLTDLTFPAPGTYSLHLRAGAPTRNGTWGPRLKKRSAPQRTLKVVVH